MGFFKKIKKIVKHPQRIIKSPIVLGAVLGAATGGLGAAIAGTSITAGTAIGTGAGSLSAVANKGNSRTTSTIQGSSLTIKSQVGKVNIPISTMSNNRAVNRLPITSKTTNSNTKTPQVNITLESVLTKMTQTIIDRAYFKSQHKCAEYVRVAVENGLGKPIQRTNSAKDYGSSLIKAGYTKLNHNMTVKIGDIVIFSGTLKNPHGHIQMYTKNGWISDYKQNSYYPNELYKKTIPSLYRLTIINK
jgi:hypothetical protein